MLELRGVTAGYGATTVLREVTLGVGAGEVVALLGANGAGKTTLLRTATGLIRPSSGTLVLDGQDVTRQSPHRLAKAGVCHIPEGRGIFPGLNVRENLTMFAPRGARDAAMSAAVEAFPELGSRMGQVAGSLSGGQQQMLSLARAYVSKPRVILLDEVSMGLAPKVVDEIFAFIARLKGEGASLLLVEQYVVKALELSDRAYILQRGRITYSGSPSELDPAALMRAYVGVDVEADDAGTRQSAAKPKRAVRPTVQEAPQHG